MITGAEMMVMCLEAEGIQTVFGYPGATICPFFDSIRESSVRNILVRQEQNAGHAASGYARMSGRPGVCVATSGPGSTNLITAIATAYMDSIPMIAITGQVRLDQLGSDVFQEADITGATEPFTKHSYLVKNIKDIPRVFKEAFHIASTGRPGPVLIDIPVDVQLQKQADFVYPDQVNIIGYKPSIKAHVKQIERAVALVKTAKRPLICAGGGVITAKAQKKLRALAEKTGIPVILTMMGIGILPSRHPLNLGMLGTHGVLAANRAIQKCDTLILAGARAGDRAVAAPEKQLDGTNIIHIDIDPAEIGKNFAVNVPIVGDIANALEAMEKELAFVCPEEWNKEFTEWKDHVLKRKETEGFINPKAFMKKLSAALPAKSVLVADVGQNQIWSSNHFEVKEGRFLTSGGMGTMGYAIPAAIGAKLAKPEYPVVAVCGDGSFQMVFNELATICQHDVPIKMIVMRNGRLGMVRELQAKLYGQRYSGTFLDGSPDFIKLAAAYGIPARSISLDCEAGDAIDILLKDDQTFLLECVVSPDELSL